MLDGMTGLILWALLAIGIEQLSLKSSRARILLDGEPTIVIKKGKIIEKAMASNKLCMLLRDKNVFSIQDVEYAILEPNGKLSVLRKQEEETVKKKDLHIPLNPRFYLPTELIVDGKIVIKNLNELNLSQEWLENQIKIAGVQSVKEVFYAELQPDGSVHIDRKDDEQHKLLH